MILKLKIKYVWIVVVFLISCSREKTNSEIVLFNKANSEMITHNENFEKFPTNWERFGIVDNDTVTYEFCYANNPKFNLDKRNLKIEILLGNELNEKFSINKITKTRKGFKFYFESNPSMINSCSFEWTDNTRQIGIWYIDEDRSRFYQFLPQERLKNFRRVVEECDGE